MPNHPSSEDGEPASAAETVKNLLRKNKEKVIIGGSVVLVVVASVFIGLAKERDVIEDNEPFLDPVAVDQKRQSPREHTGREYQRRARDGIISVGPYVRGVSAA
ncbi:hypothetical protein ABZ845_05495 [Streptomyces sp. NPDC047022]|uniref:hypothetical protein n=1 Tax=Streptomyces sp. NPDC047022 TaxID=3155737 RepID=UPI0033FEE030